MASRIANYTPQAFGKDTAPVKSKPYLEWLHGLPCIITGRQPVEAAHVSFANPKFGATGRGKGQKASDRWALPLHPDLHREQHDCKGGNEQDFWIAKGINPHFAAVILWGLWSERKQAATASAERLIRSGLGRIAAPADLPGT